MTSITKRFSVPVSTVSARNAWHNAFLLCPKFDQKFGRGCFHKNSGGGGVRHASWNPYPISDQNLLFSLPYFRPDKKFNTLFQTWNTRARRVTSCYGTYTVVGVNIKSEMVLSPNDEEASNSSKKHTQFKTRVHKPIPYFRLMYRSNRSFNIPPGQPSGHVTFLKIIVQIPPTRAKMPFKCPTLRSIQVIKYPHPGDISQEHKWQKDVRNAFNCRPKSL